MVVAFFTEEVELVTKAVPDGGLANLNGKCRTPVLSSQDTDNIYVVKSIPKTVKKGFSPGRVLSKVAYQCFVINVRPS